jgi:peptide/nickel transport system substrate-binding protein/oligopeptide transport system substrate-binding protein
MRPPGRAASREALSGFLGRFPPVALAVAALVGVGAIVAVALAVRSSGGRRGEAVTVGGGTLRVGVVGLGSLDPADARDPTAVMVADQLFDTLVSYDSRTFELRPGLARSWDVNQDQTVFTFHLAPEDRFHDGSTVTATDVKFSLERIARKGSDSPLVAQLETVSGYRPYHVEGSAASLAGVETPDPGTVVVRLDRPFSSFPAVLGHPGFGVVSKAAIERLGDGFKKVPVGSGPFALQTADEGSVHLARAAGHTPAAKLDRIDLVRFPDAGAAYQAFQDGHLELAPVPPGRAEEAAKRFGTRGMRPFLGLVFYAMNLKSPALGDVRLRTAITAAIDRQRIVDDVYRHTVQPASGLVSDGVPGKVHDACGDRCRHDLDRARALVAEVFPQGGVPEVAIDHLDGVSQAVATSIKADLDAAGIPAVLRPHAFADYGQFIVSGEQQLFRLGWIADYPSPDAFLFPLFSSASPDNLTGLASPEVDDALQAARKEADPATREQLYREVEQKVLSQFVVVPVAQLQSRMVVAKRVQGFTLDPMETFDAAKVTVAAT